MFFSNVLIIITSIVEIQSFGSMPHGLVKAWAPSRIHLLDTGNKT